MAKAKTLNLVNLEALGAKRLAELLLELSTGSAAAKRQLRLALAGGVGSAEAAREVAKRLAAIATASGKPLPRSMTATGALLGGPLPDAPQPIANVATWWFGDGPL